MIHYIKEKIMYFYMPGIILFVVFYWVIEHYQLNITRLNMTWAGGTCFRLKGTGSHRCDIEEEKILAHLQTLERRRNCRGVLKPCAEHKTEAIWESICG